MLAKKVADNCTPAEKSFGLGSTAECLESLAGQLVGCHCFAINNFGAVNVELIKKAQLKTRPGLVQEGLRPGC